VYVHACVHVLVMRACECVHPHVHMCNELNREQGSRN